MKITVTVVCVLIVLSGIILIPNVFGEYVPTWVKNTAGWWASDQIDDSSFLQGIQYLIKEGIMVIPPTEMLESSQSQEVPTWVKNTAGWWAEDKISEVEFVNAIEFLIKHGIINVNDNSSCVNNLSEIFGDSNAVVKDTCDLHESTEYSELVPAIDKINYNSLGLRGPEFSIIKSPDTYRIFMVGGSTTFGLGSTADEHTIPAYLESLLNEKFEKNIKVINAGVLAADARAEVYHVENHLIKFDPDLIIVFDGYNDSWTITARTTVRDSEKTYKFDTENLEKIREVIKSFTILKPDTAPELESEQVETPQTKIQKVPDWVRNIFIWYSEEQISEDELLNAIKFLVNQGIINLDS